MGNHRARPNERASSDRHSAQDRSTTSNGGASADSRRNDRPVCLSLKAITRRCSGISVIRKHDAMPDEDVVFDRDAFAHEAVGRDLAPATYLGALLDLDERADFRFLSYPTSI